MLPKEDSTATIDADSSSGVAHAIGRAIARALTRPAMGIDPRLQQFDLRGRQGKNVGRCLPPSLTKSGRRRSDSVVTCIELAHGAASCPNSRAESQSAEFIAELLTAMPILHPVTVPLALRTGHSTARTKHEEYEFHFSDLPDRREPGGLNTRFQRW